ncbi:MAG: hypothetical protein Q4B91_07210 [Atopobiaceae bacterium]|nr:hypothetical protein [Atopobiaceae bacterium]
MKKMDEMDRSIQLRAEERGYKAVLVALCVWTLGNVYQSIVSHTHLDMLPCLVLCVAVCVQAFSQVSLKWKMTAGDEEYQETNTLAHTVIMAAVVLVVVLSIGAYLVLRA